MKETTKKIQGTSVLNYPIYYIDTRGRRYLPKIRISLDDILEANKVLKQIKIDMSRIQLHKSIQHVTTANGKLSDKTIKLINKMAKKAYGNK